ncbi:uncharacterized protein LOC107421114 isoform X1 [Ziziphus jujuba]|uniref:Uncharacterized protein LOC107421114 isoform X1 n=1 Tax=Ziziphus jujuba TaxID=326968 RepID=A0A6P3ZVW6_ZIZJJ|nr:uncharacterized protein LOC107421114 isoform X1 [Ziziphus jujuba]
MGSCEDSVTLEEPPSCLSNAEQNLCLEFSRLSGPQQQSCSELCNPLIDPIVDPTGGPDQCSEIYENDNTGCSSSSDVTVNRDGMVGGNENADVLAVENMLKNQCGDGGDCLNENRGDNDICNMENAALECLKDDGLQIEDGLTCLSVQCELPSAVTDSPRICDQQDGDCLNDNRSDNDVYNMESAGECLKDDRLQIEDGLTSLLVHCELPLEASAMTGSQRIYDQQDGDCWNDNRSDSDICNVESAGECLKDDGLQVENGLTSSPVCCELPLEASAVTGSPKICGQQDEEENKGSSCLCGEEGVIEKKADVLAGLKTDLCEQVSPLQVCETPLESVSSDTVQQNKQDFKSIDHPSENLYGKIVVSDAGIEADVFNDMSFLNIGEMPSEVHTVEEMNDCNGKNDQKDDHDIGLFVERVAEVDGIKSNLDACIQISSSSSCQESLENLYMSECLSFSALQNEQMNDNSSPSAKKDIVTVGEKIDFTTDVKDEIDTQILPLEKNTCNFTEGSSGVASDCIVENSISPKSCQPLVIVNTDSPRMLNIHDQLGNDVSGPTDSCNAVDCCQPADNEVKDSLKVDFVVENKCCDVVSSSSRRSSQRGKAKRKTKTKKAARKCRSTDKASTSQGSIKLCLTARKKRSSLSKPARSSIWGLLGNITQLFENCNGLELIQVHNRGLQKSKGGKKIRKWNKSGGAGGSSNTKCSTPTNGLRLKVKMGKVGQNCISFTVPEVVHTLPFGTAISGECRTESCPRNGLGSPKLVSSIDDELRNGETVRQLKFFTNEQEKEKNCADASILDAQLANRDLEGNVITEKLAGDLRANFVVGEEASGILSDSRCKDPGTSPDSEVIDLIPNVHVDLRPNEDLHATVLTPPNDFVAPVDLTSSKRGKKKNKVSGAGNCIVEDGSPCPVRINKSKPSKRRGKRQNSSDGICSTETLTSSASANASSNSSSNKEISKESLHLSGETELGVSAEASKIESSTEAKTQCNLDASLGLSKSQKSKNSLSAAKTKGRAIPKSRSKGSVSGSKRVNARRKKETQRRSVSKKKTKEKTACDQVVGKVESDLEEGNCFVDDTGKTHSDSNIASGGPVEQYLPPNNAWARCDDCLKWRRIPAELADSIEETKCTWTCKDNMDKAFACCSIPQEKSNAEINAELELSDASGEEDASGTRLNQKGLECRRPTFSQENVIRIRTNQFLHRSRKTQTIDEIMVCHCKRPSDGSFGCGDDCLNRVLNIECVQGACPCGDLCSNQQFQKRQYAKVEKYPCGKKGHGLKLSQDISKGQFLIEYVGEVLDMHAYEARQKEYALKGHKHFYFMTLNGSEVIDACVKGNLGRFINHSCDPNCRTEKWMVNGEICIGLFALRDIKKGEEVTFDYNYVRVFGAAAQKCYCGSNQCRGYIGGDPLNSDVIVQDDSDDEFPEPVMLPEDCETEDSLDNLKPKGSSSHGVVMQTENKHGRDKSITAIEKLEITKGKEDSMNQSTSDISHTNDALEVNDLQGKLPSSAQPFETSQQADDATSKPMSVQQEITIEEENMEKSLSSSPRLEIASQIKMVSKSLSDGVDGNRKLKSDAIDDKRVSSKAHHKTKTSHSATFVKKGKVKHVLPNAAKVQVTANKSQVLAVKPKKLIEGASRIESVEEKLNELLDTEGGISKRKDATKGYLKLLLLTAASGDSANGEAIQSNRDLSMILDALLKTKSRVVLIDILNKNGLRMLHNIMKQYRRDFKKIPILRKLLKVLEYLAVREILSTEHINGGPPCPGMESFRESMLSLTEHDDKQVHQIARNFRDRWIPRPIRKPNFVDRDDGKTEFHRSSNSYRFSHNNWRDQGGRPTEAIDCVKQSTVATPVVDAGVQEGCSAPSIGDCPTSGTKTRKRKSRWDQPAEIKPELSSLQHKEQKMDSTSVKQFESSSLPGIGAVAADYQDKVSREEKNCSHRVHDHHQVKEAHMAHDGRHSIPEDIPPGFSSPLKKALVSPIAPLMVHNSMCPDMVIGQPQEKFVSRLPVSYGIPLSIMQQYGTPHVGSMVIAPGMPFIPFPPLPPYPRDNKNPSPSLAFNHMTANEPAEEAQLDGCIPATSHSEESSPSTTGDRPDADIPLTHNQNTAKRGRETSCDLGRRYFKQQKWNNSKSVPPWLRNRLGCMGNARGGSNGVGIGKVTNELRSTYCSEDLSCKAEKAGNNFYQHSEHQNQH